MSDLLQSLYFISVKIQDRREKKTSKKGSLSKMISDELQSMLLPLVGHKIETKISKM